MLYVCSDRGIPFGGTKGASIHVREFLEAIIKHDFSPTVAVARRDGKSDYQPDYPVHMLPNHPDLSFLDDSHDSDRQELKEAKDYYRNEDVQKFLEVLYRETKFGLVYERYSLFGTAGCLFAQSRSLPFVLEVNAPLLLEASNYRQLSQMPLARSVEKYLFSNADHILAVSDRLRDYIVDVVPTARVTVVPYGVSIDNYATETDTTHWRQRLAPNSPNDFIIGFCGSVKPWHGVDLLLEAMGGLVEQDKDCTLCIVGSGDKEYEAQLYRLCRQLGLSEQVNFTGALSFEDVPHALKSMDVLVAPYPNLTNFYFSPLKLFEYMAAGKPIIASGIGQITSLLTHEKNALLVTPGDSSALVEAVRRLRSDESLRSELSRNALEEVHSKHSWHKRLEPVVELFDRLQQQKKTGKVKHADTL